MVEQVSIFSSSTENDGWKNSDIDNNINKFLAEKNEKGEYKSITRVMQNLSADGTYLVITIFYQWVKGEPDLGPFRTAPKGE